MTQKTKKICVFASSSNLVDEIYYTDARELGKLIGQNGYDIVYGGSTLGLMWACANKVKENGGKIYGVMPQKLVDLGCRTDNCDTFHLSEGMRDRKAKMDEISDAVIALAGGFGTLEELSEMIVQKQLGYNKKPIVILNTNGFYNDLAKFFNTIIHEKFAGKNSDRLYKIVNTPKEAITYIKSYQEPEKEFSKQEIFAHNIN